MKVLIEEWYGKPPHCLCCKRLQEQAHEPECELLDIINRQPTIDNVPSPNWPVGYSFSSPVGGKWIIEREGNTSLRTRFEPHEDWD